MDVAVDSGERRMAPGRRRMARTRGATVMGRSPRLPKVVNAAAASCGAPVSVEADWATTCELTIGHHGSHRHGDANQSVWRGRLAVLRG